MSDRLLVSTRKGLIVLERTNGAWSIATTAFPGRGGDGCHERCARRHDLCRAQARAFRPEGASLRRRRKEIRRRSARLRSRPMPPARRPCSSTGRWRPAVRSIRSGCGWAAFPRACSAPTIVAGRWQLTSSRCGKCRSATNGSAAATTTPEFIRCRPIRAIPNASSLAISCAGVWETRDDGKSWTLIGDGHGRDLHAAGPAGAALMRRTRIASCAVRARPTTCGCSTTAASTARPTSGVTWTQIRPPGDDFGFAVAVHPSDPDTAWLVPAMKDELRMPRDGAMYVHRTRDGGATWQALRNGLPQRDAFDLVYRHGLDVDERGEQLAMGSTTGALWISDDGGDALATRQCAPAADLCGAVRLALCPE